MQLDGVRAQAVRATVQKRRPSAAVQLCMPHSGEGSWWPAWQQLLTAHSAAKQVPARTPAAKGSSLGEAPGRYVRE